MKRPFTEHPPLSSKTLASMLPTKLLGQTLHVLDEISSTNDFAIQLVESSTDHGTVVVAERQTKGRGRLGRHWHSPRHTNLYCSIIFMKKPPPPMVTWVPLVSGIAIAETVESLSNLEVSLKWPNDVMIKGKKLGGILCESSLKGPQGGGIVVGIGVNINIRKEALPEPLIETATSLAIESGGQFDRHCVLATLLGTLESSYDLLLAGGLQSLRASYLSRCSTLGRQIQVRFVNGNCLKGFAVDIGKDGSLQMIPSTNTSPPCTPRPSVIEIRAGDVLHLD